MEKELLRRRLLDGPRSADSTNTSALSSPGGATFSPNTSRFNTSLEESQRSFVGLSSPESYSKVLNLNPERHFDQIIQKAGEYLAEVHGAILSFKSSKSTETDLIDTESRIDKTLSEVSRIAGQLQKFVEETSTRRTFDSAISPRVVSAVKYREASLDKLLKAIRDARKSMQVACTERERKDLLNDWSPFDRSSRTSRRDAEEMISDSTERLMNSKRILLETIQSSSGTLNSLATSSQSVQSNDQELHTQTSIVSSARSLLQKYGRRASTDKVLIWLGFIFFGFCALIVAYRRIF